MPQPLKNLTPQYLAARHRKQVFVQIWLPLIGGLVIALALATLAVIGTVQGSSEVNRWGNMAAVAMIIPHLITSLIGLVVLLLTIRVISLLYRKIPGWLARILDIFLKVRTIVHKLADRVAAPIISINVAGAKVKAVRKKLSL